MPSSRSALPVAALAVLLLLLPAAARHAPADAQTAGAQSYTCSWSAGLDPGITWSGEVVYAMAGGEPRADTKSAWVIGDNDWNPFTM
jgi:hypothetical protein